MKRRDLIKLSFVLIIISTLLGGAGLCFGKEETPERLAPDVAKSESPLSIEHFFGVYIFSQTRPHSFVNGFVEFNHDHSWTLVVHFDDNGDRITDRYELLRGIYQVRMGATEPYVQITTDDQKTSAVENVVFMDGQVDRFTMLGFSFVRKKSNDPFFDHSRNIKATAKELRIETDPAGAAVYLDGVIVEGHTPLILYNPPAERTLSLRIEMVDYSTIRESITLSADEEKELSFTMVSGHAEFWISTKPWTRVIFDGQYRGDAPVKIKGVEAGIHQVVLENSGAGISESFEVELPEGEVVKKQIEFTGTLDIFVGRDADIVNKNGKVLGRAPMKGLKLPVGNHTLRLYDNDKNTKIIVVKIKLDQVTTLNMDWSKLQNFKD